MNWNWEVIWESLPKFFEGVILTVELVGISSFFGLFFGLVLALLRLHSSWWVKAVPFVYILFFRGTPLLIQLYLIYYGLSQFEWVTDSFFWDTVLIVPFWCAIIAFTLNTSAYIAEIIRGAIQSIPKGELEAAEAIGMSPVQKLTRIVLPRAFGIMIPAYSNEIIFMLKGSSLAMTISLMELTGIAKTISARTYTIFELYLSAAVIYLLLTWVVLFVFRQLEKRSKRHNNYVPPEVTAGVIGKV